MKIFTTEHSNPVAITGKLTTAYSQSVGSTGKRTQNLRQTSFSVICNLVLMTNIIVCRNLPLRKIADCNFLAITGKPYLTLPFDHFMCRQINK